MNLSCKAAISVAFFAIFGFSTARSSSIALTLPSTVSTLVLTPLMASVLAVSAASRVGIFFSRASTLPTQAFRASAVAY